MFNPFKLNKYLRVRICDNTDNGIRAMFTAEIYSPSYITYVLQVIFIYIIYHMHNILMQHM